MGLEYHKVNLYLDGPANQQKHQPMLFLKLGDQKFFAKVDELWGYHQLLGGGKFEGDGDYHAMGEVSLPSMPIRAPDEYQARMIFPRLFLRYIWMILLVTGEMTNRS